jgi:ATP-dependent Clp protease protease subunit
VPLRGRLNKDAATCYIARFLVLAAEDSARPIIAYVVSSGGFASEALMVMSTMSGIRCPIVTFCPGTVTGPAIAIASGGMNGFRVAAPAAVFSFTGFEINGAARDSEGNDPVLGVFAEALSKSTGQPPAKIIEWIRSGARFSAAEACQHGLIDEVADEPVFPELGNPQ